MPKTIGKLVGNSIKLPPNMAVAGWDIDDNRLREFCKHFGISWDIHFRWTAGEYRIGCHRTKRNSDGSFHHGITINQYRPIEESRETILHELCHAIQKDKVEIRDWIARQRDERGRYGYRNSPIEVEARQFAIDNLEIWGDILY